MGGKTAARVKNENTRKNYDRIHIQCFVQKGKKSYYQDEAKAAGIARRGKEFSLAEYIRYCMDREIDERKGGEGQS